MFARFPSITLKRLEFQSRSREPPLPIIPIEIVAYTFWKTTFLEIAVHGKKLEEFHSGCMESDTSVTIKIVPLGTYGKIKKPNKF